MTRVRALPWSRQDTALVAIGLVTAVVLGLTLDAPRQIVFIGLIEGLSIGLLALGIVLIYRTSRIINFAVGAGGTKSRASWSRRALRLDAARVGTLWWRASNPRSSGSR